MCLPNLNIAVLTTVFHLFALNESVCCALLFGGKADISSLILQAFRQSLGSCGGSRQCCIDQCCCVILESSVPQNAVPDKKKQSSVARNCHIFNSKQIFFLK